MRKKKLIAISSGGGHWVQLLRLRPGFADCDVTYATTRRTYICDVEPGSAFHVIPDCNRRHRLRMIRTALAVIWMLIRVRPDVVVSTGAAPGYFAVLFAHRMGIRTIWVDSVANAEELSLSGQRIKRHADLWLTQWQHLARPEGPAYRGSVL